MRGRLSRDKKHFGEYTNSKKETKDADIAWKTTKNGAGFILLDTNTNKVFVPTFYKTLADLMADVDSHLNGKTEDLKEVVPGLTRRPTRGLGKPGQI